jgi:TRAP-type uncharacterized transport system fused permease subunit
MQIDAYAARKNLKGLPKIELPSLGATLREGWYFVFVFTMLIVMLIYLRREALAPFYATGILLFLNQVFPRNRWRLKELKAFLIGVAKLLTELTAILAAVGLIVGALSMTGMAGTLVNDLVFLAGGSTLTLLVMGAITSFIMGIGMTVTAAYIFLAVILAPALIQGGLSPMAVHLFILYWGMLSFITPPVALGAYAAAALAEASPMRTGLEAMRLGSIIYFIPFFFVLNPALILEGSVGNILICTVEAFAGVALVAAALQGYLIGIGSLDRCGVTMWPVRTLLTLSGMSMATPGGGLLPWSNTQGILAAIFMLSAAALLFAAGLMLQKNKAAKSGDTA